jgi:excisionase family DNA binding protein
LRPEFQSLLQVVLDLPAAELPKLLGEIEEIRCTAFARLSAPALFSNSEPEKMLSIAEAAQRLNMSRDYLYRHGKEFPFMLKIGRKLLFSNSGIDRYIRQQDGLTARRHRLTLGSL